ncbi:RNA polymerase sigma factor [Benzoatithermus flavus]|uniref:RNA polymerase sigma factor n=1 Tax=Benzoatithermus flavus TaxID=3108223 RepID=A0ABU8XWI6_9PROT
MSAALPRPIDPPGATAPDAELVARARRGDHFAFELIMRRHNRRLFRLARSLVPDDPEAEDVLQEAYVRAFARLGELADGQALAAWLARIVANEALGRLRLAAHVVPLEARRRRSDHDEEDGGTDNDPASDEPGPERLAASGELRRLLEAAVDALPEEFRAVFVLREVEGLSTAETAAALAIRPETVKTRLHRARRLLQEALGDRLLGLSPCLFEFDGGRCDRVTARVLARLGQEPPAAVPSRPAGPAVSASSRQRWLGRLLACLERWRGKR